MLQPTTAPQPRDHQRLTARLRETGTTLLVTTPWPGAELRLTTTNPRFAGLGDGWGQITSRTVDAHCTGRHRAGTRTRSATLLLPGPDGTAQRLIANVEPAAPPTTATA